MIIRLSLAAALLAATAVVPTFASAQQPGAAPAAAPARGGRAAAAPRRPTADEVTRIFKFIDADHDGKLSKFEWIGAGRDIHAWDTVDTDKNASVSEDEFQKWMATRPMPTASNRGGGGD